MGRESGGVEGDLLAHALRARPGLARVALVAIAYNSISSLATSVVYLSNGYPVLDVVIYQGGASTVIVCLSVVISIILDAHLGSSKCISWRLVLLLSFSSAIITLPAVWLIVLTASKLDFGLFQFLSDGLMIFTTGYVVWSILHLCIRSAERAIAQERRVALLRAAMLRYENEALSCTLDSGFFMDALLRIARALEDGAGVLAGEIVMSLAERMRAALAPSDAPSETSVDAAFVGSIGRPERGEMTDASLRRLLLIGVLGVWAALFCASFVSDFSAGRLWWKSLSDYGGQAIVGVLWCVLGGRFLQRATTYRARTRYLVVFGACVLGVCASAAALFLSFAWRGDLAWPPLHKWIFGFEVNYVAPIFIGWAAVYLLIQGRRREIARLNAAAEIREAALNARNALLRQQVNPHFLFNMLNALYALILDRQFEQARGMVAAMRRFLDRAEDPQQGELVALSSELATQDAYLEIERVRFGDRLRVDRRIDAEVAGAKVPHLILQPLVENAVKYAVARTDRPVAVEIRARRTGRELVLAVADTGAPEVASRPPGLGMGLRNVEARLKGLYGEAGRLACRPLEPAGFLAEVRLPLSL